MGSPCFVVGDTNIALPILLVNRKTDIFIEIPIFYVLISKRKPDIRSGCLEFIKMSDNKENAVIPKGNYVSVMVGETDSESIQKAIRDAAKTLNVAYNAKFINRVEWRTETIDRLLSSVHIKSVDEAIVECQKIENYVFGESESKDIDPLASWYF
jgi:hypothetical protein